MAKIALFIPSLRGGGAERVWVTLANGFAKRGYDVDLLLTEKTGPYLELVSDQVNIVDFQKGRVLTSLFPLMRYLKENKPAALLSAMNHTNIISIWANVFAGSKTKIIVSVRGAIRDDGEWLNRVHAVLFRVLIKLFYSHAHTITTVSSGVSESMRILLPKQHSKIITVYNPVIDQELFAKIAINTNHPWFIHKDKTKKPIILSAGRLEKVKDYASLISAFSIVRRNRVAQLVILGEGKERPGLELLIKRLCLEADVDLPGFVDNPFAYMKKADLFVLSSKWEGLPGVLIQAMACGTPVVSTDCPHGPAEILENGKWGKLVPVGDIDALANAMLEALERKKHPDVATRAKAFSVNTAVDKYLDVMGF